MTDCVLMLAHFSVTCALIGLIWVVQCVIYPQFSQIDRESFPAYHADYTRRISWIVAPLMLAEIGTALWLILRGDLPIIFYLSMLPLLFVWLATWFVQVPYHGKLSEAFDAQIHRALVKSNRWRTAAWSLRGACLIPCLIV